MPQPAAHPAQRATSSAGFTIMELVVVMGVISILAGIGLGFISGNEDSLGITRGILRNQLRLCYETARNEGRPTELLLVNGGEDGPDYLRAKALDLVASWHLEENERAFGGYDPVILGIPEPAGRFGACLRHDPDKRGDMLVFDTKDRPAFDIEEGFSLSIELFFEARARCTVLSLDKTLQLELDSQLLPAVDLALADETGRGAGARLELRPDAPALPLRRWLNLQIEYDRRELRLLIDGEVVARTPGKGRVYQPQGGQLFRVSLDQTPVPGKVDEIRLLGYFLDEPQELPQGIQVEGIGDGIAFDRLGRLRAPVTLNIKNGPETERREVGPGGILR